MSRKIIKLKEGDTIPDGANYLHSEQVKEKSGEYTSYGFLWDTVYNQYRVVTYFYYEVEEKAVE